MSSVLPTFLVVDVSLARLLIVWACAALTPLTAGYNVDTDFPLVFSGPPGSYFGFSVALINNSRGSWLLSGAPLASSRFMRGVNSSGAVFRCPLHGAKKSCFEVRLDDRGNAWGVKKGVRFKSRKDYQWLGASLDVKPSHESQVVACAPHWSDAKFRDYHYLVNGMCFVVDVELDRKSLRRLYPLVVKDRQVAKNGVFVYASGMSGFSAHYAQDDSLLLGAPGVNDWDGGVVSYQALTKEPVIAGKFTGPDSYTGFSLTSGRMYGDRKVYYVTGAPRANAVGEVYIMNKEMLVTSKLTGKQVGENFGAAVLAVDVNGDGFDDVLVGAPYFSDSLEEGRVYIFINKDLGIFYQSTSALVGSNSRRALFGSAISDLRDINLDGFPDIVVGAPFEGEGEGAIYIYNGYEKGLRAEFSQRIAGSMLGAHIRAFGAAFSRVHDIDGNSYGDFAVGMFQSDKAVVLRSRPVINMEVQIKFSVQTIDLTRRDCAVNGDQVTCFTVTACFQYHGTTYSADIDIAYNLTADTLDTHTADTDRVSLNQESPRHSLGATATVSKHKYICAQHQAVAYKSEDIVTPVKFTIAYQLLSLEASSKPSLSDPVLDVHRSQHAAAEISFLKNCGSDNACWSALSLETRLILTGTRDYLVSGDDWYVTHEVAVTNTGEPAYLSRVNISYPAHLQYVRITTLRGPAVYVHVSRLPGEGTDGGRNQTIAGRFSVECEVGNPLRTMETVLFQIKLFVDSRVVQRDPFQLLSSVRTESRERNDSLSDNSAVDYLLIRLKASLVLNGRSSPEQLQLLRADFETRSPVITERPFTHVYEVGNLGPSLLPLGTMYVSVAPDPRIAGMMGVHRLEVLDPLTGVVKRESCRVSRPGQLRHRADVTTATTTGVHDTTQRDKAMGPTGQERPYTLSDMQILELCAGADCAIGECTVRNLRPETSVHVRVEMYVHSNLFVEIEETNLVKINSTARFVEGRDPMYIAALSPDRYNQTIETVLFTESRRAGVSVWAVAASCSSGLLVVLVLDVLLWRAGFFRRKKKEDLARLIEERDSETGSRINSTERDNVAIGLRRMPRHPEAHCSDSSNYEEPVCNFERGNQLANGHSSRLLSTS